MKQIILICLLITIVIEGKSQLQPGDSIPGSSNLLTMEGNTYDLIENLKGKPALIIFYRASWCPYCNQHLSDIQDIEKRLIKMGFKILAITPESWQKLNETKTKNLLKYTLLSDPGLETIEKFKVRSGSLPIPSAFLVDSKGIIRYVYSNTDYKVRAGAYTILEEAEKIKDGLK